MSRLVKEDFGKLCDFIRAYCIKAVADSKKSKDLLSAYHKKYLAYLIIVEELHLHVGDAAPDSVMQQSQYDFLQESCSDVGQAFFLMFHGCYKGSKLLLRSSIENFLKCVGMDKYPDLPTTKSVYEIFDKTKTVSAFVHGKEKLHSRLHNEYATLCQDVHTADKNHMASISGLSHFPSFETIEANTIVKIAQRLVSIYITVLALKYNQIYHSQKFFYKEICNETIIKEYRREVHNV